MMTSLLTPAHYIQILQQLRAKTTSMDNEEHIIGKLIWLFENGMVAELRQRSSSQVLIEFMMTINPKNPARAHKMRYCVFTATRQYSQRYFIRSINEEDRRTWLGYLANTIHFGNTDGDPDLTVLRDLIRPDKSWTFKKYGEHDYGSLTRRLQEAYTQEESAH